MLTVTYFVSTTSTDDPVMEQLDYVKKVNDSSTTTNNKVTLRLHSVPLGCDKYIPENKHLGQLFLHCYSSGESRMG